MSEEASKPLWAKCAECDHCWPVVYLPMIVAKAAELALKHSDCPKCGGTGMVAKQNDGELLEQPHD
ncbi:hypothetical protein LCGC14_2132070 [marine sediment metagenome]|uniref:Uncharacterized protein n=1 Tax=marine sediment metagenome TaxID=412755 RepID=A0A0F9E115_9ZZZZ